MDLVRRSLFPSGAVRALVCAALCLCSVAASAQAAPPVDAVLVKGGTFLMGALDGESDEKPTRNVALGDFYLGRHEVTQEFYEAVMGVNPSFMADDPKRPVEQVSWFDAVRFCNALSLRDRLKPAYRIAGAEVLWDRGANGWRLPTEAEWEYAAKGGAAHARAPARYAGSNSIDAVAWYSANSGRASHPVGEKAPNPLGLHDMSGNVWEWCWDFYGAYPEGDARDPAGPASGDYRVTRGGNWYCDASFARNANRYNDSPDLGSDGVGFRLARNP